MSTAGEFHQRLCQKLKMLSLESQLRLVPMAPAKITSSSPVLRLAPVALAALFALSALPSDAAYVAAGGCDPSQPWGCWTSDPHPFFEDDNGDSLTEPLDTWTPPQSWSTWPPPTGGSAYGAGTWVAVFDQNVAGTSPDGKTWTPLSIAASPAEGTFTDIAFGSVSGSSMFAAVGGNVGGVSAVYTSPTGTGTWDANPVTAPSASAPCVPTAIFGCWYFLYYQVGGLNAITHGTPGGTGKFVAVGATGAVVTSTDGQAWTPIVPFTTVDLNSVAWSGDRFMAAGYSTTGANAYYGEVWSSPDGLTWTLVYRSPTQYQIMFNSIAYGNGLWVAVGESWSWPTYRHVFVSADNGATWSSGSLPYDWPYVPKIAFGEGKFAVVCMYCGDGYQGAVFTSGDGLAWDTNVAWALYWDGTHDISYGNGMFLSTGPSIVRSDDGTAWYLSNDMAGYDPRGLAYDGTNYIAGGLYGFMATSTDRVNWRALSSDNTFGGYSINEVDYGAGTFVAVGDNGRIAISPDSGQTWTRVTSGTTSYLHGVAFRPGQWLAVGTDGVALLSTDHGESWMRVPIGGNMALHGVAAGDGLWTVVGENGLMFTSSDGYQWTLVTTGTTAPLYSVAFDVQKKWAAVGAGGTILTSSDGLNWVLATGGPTTDLRAVASDGSSWVATGAYGAVRSVNGVGWTAVPYGSQYAGDIVTDAIPPLQCLPVSQQVGIGQRAHVGGGGGTWPYTWDITGSTMGNTATGAIVRPAYNPTVLPTTYSVIITDSSTPPQQDECSVEVVENPPPPPPMPMPGCGYLVETIPFAWDEIARPETAAPAMMYDQAVFLNKPAGPEGTPFKFSLCGAEYEGFWLAASGHMCFENNDALPTGTMRTPWTWWGGGNAPTACGMPYPNNLPSPSYFGWLDNPKPAVFGLWTYFDLMNSCGNTCRFYEIKDIPGDRVFIYEFKDVTLGWPWNGPGALQSFQIKLFEDSDCIQVHYMDVHQDPNSPWYSAGAGYQNADGTQGYERFLYDWTMPDWALKEKAWSACPFQARPDNFKFNEDQGAQPFDVTANDITGPAGYRVVSYTGLQPQVGTLVRNPGPGTFTYTPATDFVGPVTFTYTLQSADGTKEKTATVTLDVQPVNDEPRFAVGRPNVEISPDRVLQRVEDWAIDVMPGPDAAVDEMLQEIRFQLTSNSNAGIFRSPPVLDRTDQYHQSNPAAGIMATLRFTPTGMPGTARLCFQAVDSGGTDIVANTWLAEVQGDDTGQDVCGEVTILAGPVAFFEPSSERTNPGRAVTFDPCPRAIPDCTHDADGAIAIWLWDFGDGKSSSMEAPRHVFETPGRYEVRLTVWDTDGNQGTYTRTVVVDWGKELPDEVTDGAGRQPPMAEAGDDRTVLEGTKVQLSGSQQGGGETTVFQWTQVSGPAVTLIDAGLPTSWFVAPRLSTMEPVDLLFALKAAEGPATGPPDYIVVHVVSANNPPQAEAGGVVLAEPMDLVTLDGSSSVDADGDLLSYKWEQVVVGDEPQVEIDDATAPELAFRVPAEPVSLHFRLTVSDGKASAQDMVQVMVQPAALEPAVAAPPAPEREESPSVAGASGLDARPLVWGGLGFLVAAGAVALLLLRKLKA